MVLWLWAVTATLDFNIVSQGGLQWIESLALTRSPWLVHAFSTRLGGVSPGPANSAAPQLNLGSVEWDNPSNVRRNREIFLAQLLGSQAGRNRHALATIRQIHSGVVFRAFRQSDDRIAYKLCGRAERNAGLLSSSVSHDSSACERAHPEFRHLSECLSPVLQPSDSGPAGDALVTDEPGVVLSVRTADCMPILLADDQQHAVAAIHAGWRGTLSGVIVNTVLEMRRAFRSEPQHLVAVIGPSIRACCYEVGEEVAQAFQALAPAAERFEASDDHRPEVTESMLSRIRSQFIVPPGRAAERARPHLDLVAGARYELLGAGLQPCHIHVAQYCTACRTDLFFSHRREGAAAGRMMAVVGLK